MVWGVIITNNRYYWGVILVLIAFIVQLFHKNTIAFFVHLLFRKSPQEKSKDAGSYAFSISVNLKLVSDDILKEKIAQGGITIIEPFKSYSNLKHEINVFLSLSEEEAMVELESWPQEILLPDPIKGRLRYDANNKLLTFKGVMDDRDRVELLQLCPDQQYKQYMKAINNLYCMSLDKGLIFMPSRGITYIPEVFNTVVYKLIEMIKTIEFDYLCGLSNSGDCLASSMQSIMGKERLTCDQETTGFIPINPPLERRLVLVDSVFQTGTVITKCEAEVKKCGAHVVKVISVIDNDMLDETKKETRKRIRTDERIESHEIQSLYKMSDLFKMSDWSKNLNKNKNSKIDQTKINSYKSP